MARRRKPAEANVHFPLTRLQALADAARQTAAFSTPQQIFDYTVQAATRLLGVPLASLWLCSHDRQTVNRAAIHDITGQGIPSQDAFQVSEGVVGWIIRHAAPAVVPDVTKDPRWVATAGARARGIRATVGVPLVADGEVLGALHAFANAPHTFRADDVKFLHALADHAALAIRKARLLQDAVTHAVRNETLNQLSAAITAGTDSAAIMRQLVGATARLLGVPYAVLWRLDPGGAHFAAAAEFVDPALGPLPPQAPIPLDRSFAGRVLREERSLVIPDVRHDARWANLTWPGLKHLGAYVGVPSAKDGALVGILVAMDRPGRTFTHEEVELLRMLGTHAALAIEKAELLEGARQATEQAQALVEVGKLLTETVELDTVLARVVEKAAELLRASACGVALAEAGEGAVVLRFRHTWGLPPAYQQAYTRRPGESVVGKAIHERRPVWTSDVLNDPGIWLSEKTRQWVLDQGIPRAILAAPMVRGDAVTGGLIVYRPAGAAYSPAEVQVLAALASQAAIAIQNARLYGGTADVARRRAALLEIGAALNAAIGHEGTLQFIIDKAVETLGADKGTLFAYDAAVQELYAVAAHGLTPHQMGLRLRMGESAAGRAILWRRPVVIPDVEADTEHDIKTDHIRREGIGALLVLPLVTGDEVVGAISLAHSQPTRFGDEDIALLSLFANQAAAALRNTRLFEDLARSHAQVAKHRERLQELYRLGVAMQSAISLQERLDLILQGVHGVLGLDRIAIFLADSGEEMLECRAALGDLDEPVERIKVPLRPEGGLLAKAFREGREVIWTDENELPATLRLGPPYSEIKTLQSRSFVILPLVSRGRVIGLLCGDNKVSGKPFEDETLGLLRTFAAQAALAIENARLYEDARQRAEQIAALYETGKAITESLNLDTALGRIAESARRLGGADRAFIWLVAPEDGTLGAAIAVGPGAEAFVGMRLAADSPAATARAAREKRVVIIENALGPTGHDAALSARFGNASLLAVPLRFQETILGALVCGYNQPRTFATAEVERLMGLAQQAAIAIENARLYEDIQRRAREATALAEVGRVLSSSLDRDRVLELVVQEVQKTMGAPFAGLMAVDEERQELVYVKGTGLSPERLKGVRLKVGEGIAGRAVAQGAPVQSSRLLEDPRYVAPGLAEEEGFRSLLCAPLLLADRRLGVLAVFRREEHAFSPAEVQLLTRFAAQAAIAIENARLFHQEQARRRQVEAVRAVTGEIIRELDLPTLLGLIHQRAAELVGVVSGAVYLWDEAAQLLVPQAWHGGEWRREVRFGLGEGFSGTVAQRREGMIENEYRTSPYASPLFLERSKVTGALSEPLMYRENLVGVITLDNEGTRPPFTEQDRETLALFAAQAAIAIENARLYAEVRSYSQELERKVEERTRELQTLNRELEKASRAKSEFLANMSHELRTPLNAVIGFADLLKMRSFGELTPKQQKYVENILTAGVHLLNLVNDVLDLARVEAGRLELRPERTALPPAIAEALEEVRPQADKKGLALAWEVEPNLPLLHADPVRLRQILANLLSNAVKFTPQGGRVTVRASRACAGAAQSPPHTEVVEISVEDTGIGIAPQDLDRLFRKFEQLEAGPGKVQPGAGLGLAITRHLVELHGGTIAVLSAGPGQGATFTVRLPVGPRGERPAVLVVDDDPVAREMLAESARAWGWEGTTAATLGEARAALTRALPDLVILDVALPDGSGVDFARELRRVLAPFVPILMYTGLGAAEGQAALAVGADDYLVKPAPLELLHRKARELLARAGWPGLPQGAEGEDADALIQRGDPASAARQQ